MIEKPPPARKPAHTIWIVVFPGFLLLDAAGPAQVFSTANDECRDGGAAEPYRIRLLSRDGGNILSSSGIALATERLPQLRRLHGGTLLLSGGHGIDQALQDKKLIAWIVRAAGVVRRCASVCNGAFLLAQAGLLQGRRAVTHWKDVGQLQAAYPDAQVGDDAIYLKDGPIYTSAGITAGIDLCLSLVQEDLGRALALKAAKRLVVFHKRPGGQRQFSAELLADAGEGELAERLAHWLEPRIAEQIDVERMAAALAVSGRNLHRRLRAETGMTPAQLLVRLRMEAACRLLETGAQSIKQVARKSGFGSEYNLRRAFAKHLKVLPTEYRQRFG